MTPTHLTMRDSALFPATAMLVLIVCGVMLASTTSKPTVAQFATATQLIADAFHQIAREPASTVCTGRRWLENLPANGNIEDRRDAIAVLIENN